MKNIVTFLIVALVIAVGYVLYQYQKIAADAEAQVEADIQMLENTFRDGSSEALVDDHKNENYVQTQLVMQKVNDEQKFVRIYHSLFIHNGQRNCLQSHLTYQQKQPNIQQQMWLGTGESCLP